MACVEGEAPKGSESITIPVKDEPAYASSKEQQGWKRYRGLMLAVASAFFLSLAFVAAKSLKGYHAWSKAQWKFMGYLIPSIPIAIYFQWKKGAKIFQNVWPLTGSRERRLNFLLLNIRGFAVFVNTFLRFWALQYLAVGDVSAIASSVPVFVMIMAHFLLRENCGVVSVIVTILTCTGILVIAHPPLIFGGADTYKDGTLLGCTLTLVSVLCGATSAIIGRRTRKVHFSVTMLSFGIWGIVGSTTLAIIDGKMETPLNTRDGLLAYGLLPVCAFLTRIATTLAQKFDSVGTVTLVDKAMDVLFAFMWQIFLFQNIPDAFSAGGAAIIMFGVIISGIRKWISTLPKDNKVRTYGAFLLY